MTAAISKEERALIDAAIAEGNITRIPTGACSETRYRWCPNMSSLVPVNGMDMSWRNQERNRAKRRFKQYELPPHIIARRKKVAELVEQRKSRSQIAEAIGCPVSQVAWDIKVMGLSTANSERVARSPSKSVQEKRVRQKELYLAGWKTDDIAKELGRCRRAVRAECKKWREAGL
jgi:IS30 family transposase